MVKDGEMAITKLANRKQADAFIDGAPDAKPAPKLRGRKKPITLTFPPDLLDRFDAAAAKHDRSRASMLVVVVRDWLEREAAA
jgi:hypothetical protein